MSTITKEFTKEQLQQIIETDHAQCGEASSLARIALASLEAQPVAWLLSGGGAKNNVSFDSGNAYADPLREVTPLYTAPPAPAYVPDDFDFSRLAFEKWITENYDSRLMRSGTGYAGRVLNQMWQCWLACRAAMLQAGNSPATPDTWIPVSERMPERDVDVQVYCADKKEQMVGYMERNEAEGWFRFASLPNGVGVYCKPTHWMPLPAAPQQEVK